MASPSYFGENETFFSVAISGSQNTGQFRPVMLDQSGLSIGSAATTSQRADEIAGKIHSRIGGAATDEVPFELHHHRGFPVAEADGTTDNNVLLPERTNFLHLPALMEQGNFKIVNSRSDEDGLLSGLAAMRTKMRSLETLHRNSSAQIYKLQVATDTYTTLLNQKLLERKCQADQSVQTVENISKGSEYSSLEKLRCGDSRSEGTVPEGRVDQSPLLRFPDGPGLRNSAKDSESVFPLPEMDFSLDTSLNNMKPVSVDLSSTGSSVRLTDSQQARLNKYRARLVEEVKGNRSQQAVGHVASRPVERPTKERVTSLFVPSVPVDPVVEQQENSERIMDPIIKKYELNQRKEFDEVSGGGNERMKSDENFSALRERLAKLKEDVIRRRNVLNRGKTQQEVAGNRKTASIPLEMGSLNLNTEHRSISEPASPVRKVQKKEECSSVLTKKEQFQRTQFIRPPFVAGKSTSVSYSLNVNLQQLLAALKSQNPTLHQLCLKLGPTTPIRQLANAFRVELEKNIRKTETSLEEQLRLYDEYCENIKIGAGDRRKMLEVEKNSLAARIEQKDTAVQRMRHQHEKLNSLLLADAGENAPRSCKLNYQPLLLNPPRTHIRNHTISSFSKVAGSSTGKSISPKTNPAKTGTLWLRDLQHMQLVLINDPEK